MPVELQRVKAIFLAAVEKTGAQERAVCVREACGDDDDLRWQVEALLRQHELAGSFLESPVFDAAALRAADLDEYGVAADGLPSAARGETAGSCLGPYRLREPLGEGGMGVVWMAEQQEPVCRTVALKIIKPGMDSKQVLTRFEAERQALALMDHPNIAQVHDAGTTEAGRPYFVMELVQGVPLTDFCDQNRLTPRERLELFVPVCQAIQHAHQKGIIHRDIKPSNVLVTLYDGVPTPKVIDFGIAKAIDQQLTEQTLVTGFGQVLGTPEYMSPEQAELNAHDVDTRSDIYSLGVLLYELLTGSTPLGRQRLKEAPFAEVLRIVREEEPPRPSTRLSRSELLPDVAAACQTEPARLTKLLRGELDWIVMRALEKDRARRYPTANSLADDLRRYLRDEPVEACPPSASYRLRKFLWRHRGPAAAAALVLLALVGGVIGTAWGLVRALDESNAKEQARQDAVTNKEAAERSAQEAQEAEADTKAFSEFLVNRVLAAARQEGVQGGLGLDVTLAKALEEAATHLAEDFAGRPRAEALALHALAVTWRGQGDRQAQAEQYLRRAIALREQELGPDHADTLKSRNSLGVLLLQGRRYADAIPLLEMTAEKWKETLGPGHPTTLLGMSNLAAAYRGTAQYDKAIPLLELTLEMRKATLGAEDPETLQSMNNLGVAYHSAKQLDRALLLFADTLHLRKRTLGAEHPHTLSTMASLGRTYLAARRPDEGFPLLEQTLEKRRKKLGPTHPVTLLTADGLWQDYLAARQPDKAIPVLNEYLAAQRKRLGPDDLPLAAILFTAGRHLVQHDQFAAAEKLLRECVQIREQKLPDDWAFFTTRSLLGASLLGQHKYAEAEPHLVQGYEGLKQRWDKIPQPAQDPVTEALQRLVQLYDAWDRKDQAAVWRKELDEATAARKP